MASTNALKEVRALTSRPVLRQGQDRTEFHLLSHMVGPSIERVPARIVHQQRYRGRKSWKNLANPEPVQPGASKGRRRGHGE